MTIKNLPHYEPEDWLWKNIESQLNSEEAEQTKLHAALALLPQHEPAVQVWNKVENTLQLAENEALKLRNALQGLKQYEPSTMVWQNIDSVLQNIDNEDIKLKNALKTLPQHEPPAVIWMKIMQELPVRRTAILRVISDTRLAAAAAMIGLILTLGVLYYANQPAKDSIELAYTKEVVDDEILKNNTTINAEDEQAFAMVEDICQQQSFICEQPEVKTLKNELDELNSACSELKEAIGQYGTDATLLQQLSSIEQERTEVLKKIIAII
jgi:hypothetical protein